MFVYPMTVGPVATNCYLLGDESTHVGAIIEPTARRSPKSFRSPAIRSIRSC